MSGLNRSTNSGCTFYFYPFPRDLIVDFPSKCACAILVEVDHAYSFLRGSAMTSLGIATILESKSTRLAENALRLIIAYKLHKDPCSSSQGEPLGGKPYSKFGFNFTVFAR
jgi:hypothetical protein